MSDPTFILGTFAFVFGLTIGSFLNVVIYRLPRGEGLAGRSGCPNCQDQLAWFDLVPLLSFLFLAGRCRRCQGRISWRYPLVELVTGLLALAVLVRFGPGPAGLAYFAFGAALIAITFIPALMTLFVTWMSSWLGAGSPAG